MITHRFKCGAVARWKNVPDNPLSMGGIVNCSKCIRQQAHVPAHFCPAQDREYVLRDKDGKRVGRRRK